MHEIYELKEKLLRELSEYARKDLSAGSLETIDKLAHAIKNLCRIIESSEEYSEDGMSSYRRGSYYRDGGGSSYRRSRDSRGRYSSNYYEAMDDMTEKLDELMKDAPDEKIKSEIQRLKQKIEQMQ